MSVTRTGTSSTEGRFSGENGSTASELTNDVETLDAAANHLSNARVTAPGELAEQQSRDELELQDVAQGADAGSVAHPQHQQQQQQQSSQEREEEAVDLYMINQFMRFLEEKSGVQMDVDNIEQLGAADPYSITWPGTATVQSTDNTGRFQIIFSKRLNT